MERSSSTRPPQRTPRTRKGTTAEGNQSRSDLLSAAVHVFARHGYDGASLQQIALVAGIQPPLIHYHFGSKEELWRAAVDHVFSKLSGALSTISMAAADLEPIDQIKIMVRVLLRLVTEEPDLPLLALNEIRSPGPRLDWLSDKYLHHSHVVIDGLLAQARDKGQIKSLHPMLFSNMILSVISQSCVARPFYEKIYGADVVQEEFAVDAMSTLLFDGLVKRQ